MSARQRDRWRWLHNDPRKVSDLSAKRLTGWWLVNVPSSELCASRLAVEGPYMGRRSESQFIPQSQLQRPLAPVTLSMWEQSVGRQSGGGSGDGGGVPTNPPRPPDLRLSLWESAFLVKDVLCYTCLPTQYSSSSHRLFGCYKVPSWERGQDSHRLSLRLQYESSVS